jgi:ParB-like chromosome segregation protein Spo0J
LAGNENELGCPTQVQASAYKTIEPTLSRCLEDVKNLETKLQKHQRRMAKGGAKAWWEQLTVATRQETFKKWLDGLDRIKANLSLAHQNAAM